MTYKILTVGWLISFITVSCTPNSKEIINIDGSSTIFPITQAITKEYNKINPKTKININVSRTGGGFKKFCAEETDISNASRAIKTEEANLIKTKNINFIVLPIAYDGITIVVNKNNTWASEMTINDLSLIWNSESKILKWSDIRPNWPDRIIRLYGSGTDSGTFDYFIEAINSNPQASRNDYIKSENDHVLAASVAEEIDALGYLSYAHFNNYRNKLRAVALSHQNNPSVMPDVMTISNGTYKPLTRTLYLYINTEKLKQKKNLRDFMNFFMEVAPSMVGQAGYIQLNDDQYKRNLIILEKYRL